MWLGISSPRHHPTPTLSHQLRNSSGSPDFCPGIGFTVALLGREACGLQNGLLGRHYFCPPLVPSESVGFSLLS